MKLLSLFPLHLLFEKGEKKRGESRQPAMPFRATLRGGGGREKRNDSLPSLLFFAMQRGKEKRKIWETDISF